jgi:PAS domain S-box-containing protein
MSKTVAENRLTENRLTENRRSMHLTSRSFPGSQDSLLSSAIETLQDSFIVTDTVGQIQYVNPAAERLFRQSSLALTHTPIAALFSEAVDINLIIHRALVGGWQGEANGLTPIEPFVAAVSVSAVCDPSGHAIGLAFVIRDITVQKQRELELERSNQLKSDFLAHMSHELRTPLTAILGFSSVLEKQIFGLLNSKQAQYISQIHRSGQHLLNLINDILDLSKIEAGQMELEVTPVDLAEVSRSAIELVSEAAVTRHITIEQDGLSCIVPGDELRLRQILINLLSNAIKFSHDHSRIGMAIEADDRMVRLCVWDEGIGIPADQQNRLFQPFQQIESSHSRSARSEGKRSNIGTGLGLALSRRLVELHQGYITVESIVDQGSRFTVHLPRSAD